MGRHALIPILTIIFLTAGCAPAAQPAAPIVHALAPTTTPGHISVTQQDVRNALATAESEATAIEREVQSRTVAA